MKVISCRLHGVLDYTVGLLLIAAPWIFGFYHGGAESWVFVAMGIFTLCYSMLTNYEAGLFRLIGFRTHLGLDAANALFLALSPALFHFSNLVYLPHLIFGVLELLVVALSNRHPFSSSVKSAPTHVRALS